MGWNGKALVSTALIVGGAILAFIGYAELLSNPEFGLNATEVVRESLLLTGGILVWPLGGPPLGFQRIHDIPLALEIARFAMPLGVFTGAGLIFGRLFGAHIRAFLARFARNHVVVCADGPDAWQFVADLRREHRDRFVVLDLHGHRGNIHERPPVPILLASGGIDERLLLKAAVPHARAIVALGNDDMRGLETVLRAKTVAAKHRPRHMAPLRGRAAIAAVSAGEATEALFGVHNATFSFRPISIARNTIRLLLERHPLDCDPMVRRGERLHVRIVGFGALGQELALEVARSGHFTDERPPLISIVDPEAATLFARLAQSRPELTQAAEFHIVTADIRDLPAWDDQAPHPSRTVICLNAELPVLQTAAALRQRSTAAGVETGPIFVHLGQAPVAAEALRAATPSAGMAPILPFGDAASLFTRDIVLEETLDTLARVVHEHYRDNRARDHGGAATTVGDLSWHDLPEDFREASRHQADHILAKLRAIRCDAVPAPAAETSTFAFRPDELDMLSRIEHRRWNAERRVAGWRFAPTRRDEAREHPSLVSWDDLSESERDKDREAVQAIPAILARAGLAIRRQPSSSP